MRRKRFRNWAGNQTSVLAERALPRTVDELASTIRRAAASGLRVKAVGAGHSFTSAACTDGIQVSLDHLDAIESIDVDTRRITVEAGVRLAALNAALDGAGLAMPNLGDIAYQSIAGAISTATHGTGAGLGNLATTVVGMEIIDGSGQRIWCDQTERPDLLKVARVGVGALGIISRVTLQCVPAFDLHAIETVEPLDDILDGFHGHATANDHFELFWMPGARRCQVKRNNRTAEVRRPQARLAYVRDKIIGENIAFGTVCRVGRRFPSLAPRVAKMVDVGTPQRDLIDASHKIFASPRWVRFYEMEYGIPVEALPEAMRRVRELVSDVSEPIMFPIEVRVSAADDIALSTGFGRDSAWIAVHMYKGTPYEEYFRGVESIMNDYDGRPHWGKLHFQDKASLQPLYPAWDDFMAVRSELDPAGRFANDYTDRVFGPA